MTHKDAGKYAEKHPEDTLKNPDIIKEIEKKSKGDTLSCSDAHKIASHFNIDPSEVGVMIDLSEKRISKCQLNLFGHGDGKPENIPSTKINQELKKEIYKKIDEKGKISCKSCWQTSDLYNISRVEVTKICEALSIKITTCQIGAF
ncbi:MAG: hypothetical protein GY714_21145 [Desulfobacterales bacterium]|nr:hypothetical protein [Desulfobacterales bacterium]MCP4159274.1 hypothetical protein [Deltaproteobacteria bacterium]